MAHTGSFYIDRFVDGANRIYEKRTYFGFQGSKEFRQLIRFKNKEAVTPEGVEAYKEAFKSIYGHSDYSAEVMNGDVWGYADAILNPTTLTGAIAFQDATTQGTQLYGVGTGSKLLLRQAGAWKMEGEELIKAYKLLALELNDALGAWWIKEQYRTIPDASTWEILEFNVFTVDNVKSINMTKLYNVGKERILTGKGYTPELTEDEQNQIFNIIEVDEEYETSSAKLGKLQPLMKTVREAKLNITKEDMWEIFNKAIWKIAAPALIALDRINTIVKDKTKTEIFEWKSLDGVNNVYAMVSHKEQPVTWITEKGTIHSYTHKYKILEAGSAWRGVAPRIIQSTDGFLVRWVLNDSDFDVVTIHDSFGSHGNNAKSVKQSYNNGLVHLYENDYLTKILSEIYGRKVKSLQKQTPEEREIIISNLKSASHALDWA